MLLKSKEGKSCMDSYILEPTSLEDSIISLNDGSTMTAAFDLCPSKIILQVLRALLMGDTSTISTSTSAIFSLAPLHCSTPSSVISTSRYSWLNFSLVYSQASGQLSAPYLFSRFYATLLNLDYACLMKYIIFDYSFILQVPASNSQGSFEWTERRMHRQRSIAGVSIVNEILYLEIKLIKGRLGWRGFLVST